MVPSYKRNSEAEQITAMHINKDESHYMMLSKKSQLQEITSGSVVKNLPANAGGRSGFDPWVRKMPWRRK